LQIINTDDPLMESQLELAPELGLAQLLKEIGEPIIAELEGAHRRPETSRIKIETLFDPTLDLIEPVVARTEKEDPPADHDWSHTEVTNPVQRLGR